MSLLELERCLKHEHVMYWPKMYLLMAGDPPIALKKHPPRLVPEIEMFVFRYFDVPSPTEDNVLAFMDRNEKNLRLLFDDESLSYGIYPPEINRDALLAIQNGFLPDYDPSPQVSSSIGCNIPQ